MQERAARVLRGRIIKAVAVFAAFFVVFLTIDRLSGPSDPAAEEAASTTETTTEPDAAADPDAADPDAAETSDTEPGGPPPDETEPGEAEPGETEPGETESGERSGDPEAETPETAEPESDQAPATEPEGSAAEPDGSLRSADGVTLQILNGTGALRLARDFKPLARQEGYQIVNSGNAAGNYPVSTIFYSSGSRSDAEAFQARFPAFEVVAPAPDTLSDTVALHAVLGENYAP